MAGYGVFFDFCSHGDRGPYSASPLIKGERSHPRCQAPEGLRN